ncbi:MAG: hypothetical protein HGJ94_06600 [Desulfosarcina sp.]|nr:hypothetical protein [Desulfosarcina sp.]
MADHSHLFIEEFDGFIGFGLNRESDMDTVIYYLQKFSDDRLMASEPEYHRYFLKDNH